MRQSFLLASALTLVLQSYTYAFQTKVGANSAEFLELGAGARSLGMGDAFAPVAEGADAIYWNPAGLAQLGAPELAYTHTETLSFFHHDFLAYALPVKSLEGALAVSLTRLSQDSLPLVNNSGVNQGSFIPHSEAVTLAYAHAFDTTSPDLQARAYFGSGWSVMGADKPLDYDAQPWDGTVMIGMAMKVINETIYDKSSAVVAADAGVLYRPWDVRGLSFGAVVRNVGGSQRFISVAEPLPLEASLGSSYDMQIDEGAGRILSAVEVALPYFGNPYGKIGVEYSRPGGLALRLGYNSLTVPNLSAVSGLTTGVGLKYKSISIDFGFQPVAELGQTYRFEVSWRW